MTFFLYGLNLYSQTEFVSPDGQKRVEIHKTADNKYQVIVDSIPDKSYKKIVNQQVYFVTESYQVVYIAECDDGYCVVVGGVEQPHYTEIFQDKITVSPDRKHWAYSALYQGEWVYITDGDNPPEETLSDGEETANSYAQEESGGINWTMIAGFNRKHFSGFTIKNEEEYYETEHGSIKIDAQEIFGNTNIGSAMGYEGYIGYGGFYSNLGGGMTGGMGYSKYKTSVTLNGVLKTINVNTFFLDLKVYFPGKWKLQPYLYFGKGFSTLNLRDFAEFYHTFEYTVHEGNNTHTYTDNLKYNADSKYSVTLYNLGFGYQFYFLPKLCFQASFCLSYLMGSASQYSYSTAGGLPTDFRTFNEYYDFGIEMIF